MDLQQSLALTQLLQHRRANASIKPSETNDTSMAVLQLMGDTLPALLAGRERRRAAATIVSNILQRAETEDHVSDSDDENLVLPFQGLTFIEDEDEDENEDEEDVGLSDFAAIRDLAQAKVTAVPTVTIVQQKMMQHEQKKWTRQALNGAPKSTVTTEHVSRNDLQPNLRKFSSSTIFGTGAAITPMDFEALETTHSVAMAGRATSEIRPSQELSQQYARLIDPEDPITGKDLFVFSDGGSIQSSVAAAAAGAAASVPVSFASLSSGGSCRRFEAH